MSELSSHYTPKEQVEIFDNWANHLSATDPELADEIVRNIVRHEFPQPEHCANADACGNTTVFTNPAYRANHTPNAAESADSTASTPEPRGH